jgi:hypothetical protein
MRLPLTFLRGKSAAPDFEDTRAESVNTPDERDLPPLEIQSKTHKGLAKHLLEWRVPLITGVVMLTAGILALRWVTEQGRHAAPIAQSSTTVLDASAAHLKPKASAAKAALDSPAISPVSPPAVSASAAYTDKVRAEASALIASSSQGTAQVSQVTPLGSDLAAVDYVAQGRPGIAWVDLRHKLVILGTILNAQGQNLVSGPMALAAATRAASAPSSTAEDQTTSGSAEPTAQVSQGSSASVLLAMRNAVNIKSGPPNGVPVWVFVDPDGARSARFFNSQFAQKLTGVLVHWVPVAYEDPQSAGRLAWILTQLEPLRALEKNFRNFNFAQSKGAAEAVMPSMSMADIAIKNTQLLSQVGPLETPTVLFCGKDGAPHVMAAPSDLASVAQIAGPCNVTQP